MDKTSNYQWDLPSPFGIQMNEVAKIATSFTAIDAKIKAFETSFSNHKHKFAELEEKPTTLGGYGITDGMTAEEVAQAIKTAVDDLINGSGAALDTLKELADALGNDPEFATTVGNALGVRVRVDAAQAFTLAERAQGRSNIDALGMVDKGKADGVASLDSTGKVPTAQLPALTTTATVGAAMAGANGKTTPADGDFFSGVLAGGSTMFKTTWANIKAALAAIHYSKSEVNNIVAGNMAGRAYPRRQDGGALNFIGSGVTAGQPPALIGGGWDGNFNNFYFYTTTSLSVGYAAQAGYSANSERVGGYAWADILNQLNWRLTDTRFSGFVQASIPIPTTGGIPNNVMEANGYVHTSTWGGGNQDRNLYFGMRQPQIFIPNVGWRALGGW
ncbi:hypothetical protein IR196_13730 [Brucella anthropi]|uniref:hypothetical protein n=1 Tax=Brucella anthropi TaxID=529 RepID=UPI00188BA95D|nr:hypothetical protein [Brucella anthropi]QPA29263.1 hypothetical protein IR196_13730 [Brucella anthropi]